MEKIVCSVHKGGTNLANNLFLQLGNAFRFNYKRVKFLESFDMSVFDGDKAKGIIFLRNPYELIMSGVRYHQKTSEKWCNTKREDLNGKTYKQHIKLLEIDDKILFEMDNSKKYIDALYSSIGRKNCIHVKMEDFYTESGKIKVSKKISDHYGLDFERVKKIVFRVSKVKYNSTVSTRSYTYQKFFKKIHYDKFDKIFPEDLLQKLDYEISKN